MEYIWDRFYEDRVVTVIMGDDGGGGNMWGGRWWWVFKNIGLKQLNMAIRALGWE